MSETKIDVVVCQPGIIANPELDETKQIAERTSLPGSILVLAVGESIDKLKRSILINTDSTATSDTEMKAIIETNGVITKPQNHTRCSDMAMDLLIDISKIDTIINHQSHLVLIIRFISLRRIQRNQIQIPSTIVADL